MCQRAANPVLHLLSMSVVLTKFQRFRWTTLTEGDLIISSVFSVAISFSAAQAVEQGIKQQVTIG